MTAPGRSMSIAASSRPGADPLLAVSSGRQGSVHVLDGRTGAALGELIGHDGPVLATAWAPSAGPGLLATGGHDGSVRIWNWATRSVLHVLHTRAPVSSVAWTRANDRLLLAVGGRDGSVRTWDSQDGRQRTLAGRPRAVTAVAWAADPEDKPLLAIACRNGTVRIGVGPSGRLLHLLNAHLGGVTGLAWAEPTDDPPLLASGGSDGAARIWDGVTGAPLLTIELATPVVALTWLPLTSGQVMLVTAERSGDVHVWDGRTGKLGCAWAQDGNGADTTDRILCLASAMTPDGQPLLYLGDGRGEIRVGRVQLELADPRGSAPAPAAIAAGGQQGQAGPAEEIVLPHWSQPLDTMTTAVAWASAPGERLLLATGHDDGAVRIWDGYTGALARTISLTPGTTAAGAGAVRSVAWAMLTGGKAVLATGHEDGSTLIRDGLTGERQITIPVGDGLNVRTLAWAVPPGGGLLLATADADGKTRVLSGHTGALRWMVSEAPAWSVAWAALPDGGLLLATGNTDGCARLYDGQTGSLLRTLIHSASGAEVNSVAWAIVKGGRPLLATGGDDGKVRIWKGDSGTLVHTLTEPSGPVFSVAWAVLADGSPVLASTGKFDERTTRIWDGRTFDRLANLPGARGIGASLAWAQPGDGRLLLCAAPGMSELPARIWQVQVASAGPAKPSRADVAATLRSLGPIEAGLLAFGRVDLWPPLGLVDDLVALTGPGPADLLDLNDGRLLSLAGHAGLRRLCDLCWPTPARVSFAGLLASGLSLAPAFRPPPGTAALVLREALAGALAAAGQAETAAPAAAAEVNLGELSAAGDTMTDRMIAMLAILGPQAVAADPAMPLLMAQSASQLPVLAGKQLRMLGETNRRGSTRPRESDGGLRHAPGTAGIGRRGSLTQLLPTQLALPPDLLTIRFVQDHLLYRRHVARVPPTPEPVTLILDTTPPTFGSVENALRLVAHLITTVLWEYGEHPVLISLAEPTVATPLTSRAHLTRLWTTRSLNPPGPAIATALDTAAETGSGCALLSHHHSPERYYLPGPRRRLVTTHHPAEQAPPPPSHPNHYHLPPDPAQALLAAVVWALLTPSRGHG